MYSEIVAAVQSAKMLRELISAAHGMSNYLEVMTAVNAVQEKLSEALVSNLASVEKQSALSNRVNELEQQVVKMENWNAEMQRYALKDIDGGFIVYALKPSMANGDPLHYLCTCSINKREKHVFQPLSVWASGANYRCESCGLQKTIERNSEALGRVTNDHDPW